MNRLPSSALLVWLAGCSSWPTSAHLPDAGTVTPAGTDPRSLVQPDWIEHADVESNDLPQAPPYKEMFLGWGTVIPGRLAGTGWSDFAEPLVISSDTCGTSASRAPESPGDYLGDVDTFPFVPKLDGHLCARARVSEPESAFDMLILELDECGVPVDFLRDAETGIPIGQDRLPSQLDWGVNVRQGTAYAVQFAAFWPNEVDLQVDYQLGLSLVPVADGGLGTLCPLLPGETE